MNFFGLRLDKAADPTLQLLAQETWKIWNTSQPQKLLSNQWHLPYIDDETYIALQLENINSQYPDVEELKNQENIIKISAARCARLSYLSFSTNKRSTIQEDLELYTKLVGGNILHASPLEHIATPDIWDNTYVSFDMCNDYEKNHQNNWKYFQQSGNLGPGWRQFRKMLSNEEVAPLPKEFSL
jgi:hypothetical protein